MNQEGIQRELEAALLCVRANPAKAYSLGQKALVRAQRNGWIGALALANLLLGWACCLQNRSDPAVEAFYRAISLFADAKDSEHLAHGYYGLGTVYGRIGEYSLAIAQYHKALSWIVRYELPAPWSVAIRIALTRALMNLGYWSDAEQELLKLQSLFDLANDDSVEIQLLVLRLAFYRGEHSQVRSQLQGCRETILALGGHFPALTLDYYQARYTAKYKRFKTGESQLSALWEDADRDNVDSYFLAFEASLDFLRSDQPKRGIHWLNLLVAEAPAPLSLKRQIHSTLANFYVSHRSHALASSHFQAAEKMAKQMRDSEVNLQWARFQAEAMHQSLRSQVAQTTKNNQILAESNALLQAVNRIAMAVNAALDPNALARRLREQLVGWIDAEVIGIAEVEHEQLVFDRLLDADQCLPPSSLLLTEDCSWSVRAVQQGRILFHNDRVQGEALVPAESPVPVRSASFTPLKCENRVIGLLSLQSRRANVFDARALSLLEYIAPVIGIALANLLNVRGRRELRGALTKQQQELDDVRKLIAHLADHDDLTGLPNRTSLPEHFTRWRRAGAFSCLLLRITNLDAVNNSTGYGMDEEILKVIGQRLRNRVRPDDLLMRVSHDQFLLFVQLMNSLSTLRDFAGQLRQMIEQPLRARDQTVAAEGLIGVVQCPDHGETLEELMSMAGLALGHSVHDDTGVFCVE